MPIRKRWSKFTKKKIDSAPNDPGIYELGDGKGVIVDIGKGDSEGGIRTRLCDKRKKRPRTVKYFRFQLTKPFQSPEALEQQHGEKFERKYGRLPRLQKRLPRKH